MAFLGLSAPAVAATAATPAVESAVETSAATTTANSGTTEAVVANAISKLNRGSSSPILASTKSDTSRPAQAEAKKAEAKKAAAKTDTKVKATAKAKKASAPSAKQLHPRGVPSNGQQSFKPSDEQLRNVREIVKAGQKMNLSPRAQVIAVSTAMQESTLKNIGHLGDRNDHDSQGLFQQRPSSGWGTPKQITNPQYAATAFYKGLVNVDGWESMPLTKAAQSVQVSAFPDHYAKWEKQAGELVLAFYGDGPYAKQAASLK